MGVRGWAVAPREGVGVSEAAPSSWRAPGWTPGPPAPPCSRLCPASPTAPSLPWAVGTGVGRRGGITYCRLGRWVSAAWGSPGLTLTGSPLSNLGVPPGRGSCPLTLPLPFDLIYTDYHGLQQMKQHMGLSFRKYR